MIRLIVAVLWYTRRRAFPRRPPNRRVVIPAPVVNDVKGGGARPDRRARGRAVSGLCRRGTTHVRRRAGRSSRASGR